MINTAGLIPQALLERRKISQPEEVDVNEILFKPTKQKL